MLHITVLAMITFHLSPKKLQLHPRLGPASDNGHTMAHKTQAALQKNIPVMDSIPY
jgi:hypothetical protein